MKRTAALMVAACLAFARPPAGAAGTGEKRPLTELELEQHVSLAFETPHTAWAKPYAGGAARALFFAPYRYRHTDTREVVELAQRFELEADAAYYHLRRSRWLGERATRPGYWPRRHYDERWAALAAADYDVYVFLGLEPEMLPEAMLERVRAAVSGGAGALLIGIDGTGLVSGREPPADTGAGLPDGSYLTPGRGRVALLPAREPLAYRLGWETEYDYLSQARGRALLWAAGRCPETALALEMPVPAAVRTAAGAHLSWRDAPAETVVALCLRRDDGRRTDLGTLAASGRGEALVTLPPLRAGRYYLSAVARGPAGVENWAALAFKVETDTPVTLELDREWADPETEAEPAVSGRVAVPETPAPGDHALQVRLRDRRGRVLARHELPSGADRFRIPVDRWMPMMLWVEALLTRGGEASAASEPLPFRITRRRRGEFNFVMWDVPKGELAPFATESLARAGVTTILDYGGSPPLYMAAQGISFMPYATWLAGDFHTLPASLDRDGVMRPRGCYNDPERMTAHVERVVEGQGGSRAHGTLAYSLGDESAVRASCLDPHCLEAYRRYLGMKYGDDIAALNESWGSDYASFAEISLLEPEAIPAPDAPEWFREWYGARVDFIESTYPNRRRPERLPMDEAAIRAGDINDEIGALQEGNFARWFDRQAFQAWNLVQAVKRFDEDIRELDPLALTGFEGTNSFAIPRNPTRIRQGGDIDLMVREFGWWGPYRDASSEVIRSLAGPEFLRGNFFGYFRDVRRPLRRYWGMINDQMTQAQWWRWDGVGRFHGLLAPHMAPYPNRQAIIDDTAVVREGLGTLLMNSEMLDDGVMLLYSFPSSYITHFDGNESYGSFSRSHGAWHSLVRGSGLQFRYVTDRQLRRGEFDPGTAPVLVLPMATAIGDREAAVIRDFVASGGNLIADVRPGIYTGRCRARETGVLDDVFGIRRAGKSDATAAAVEIPGLMSWDEGRVDPAVETAAGRARAAAGETPVLIVNEYGAGRAVLLNFPLERAPAGNLVLSLLAEAGVHAPVTVEHFAEKAPEDETDPGADPGDIDAQLEVMPVETAPHIRRWRNGGIEFLSVTAGLEMEVVLTIPGARHVYDLRRREALGRTGTFGAALEPERAHFFALLPAAAPRPAFFADRRLALVQEEYGLKRGARLEAALAVPGAAGPHALRLSAFGPDGQAVDYFDRVVIAGPEPVPVVLPFAFDDPPGQWRLEISDLYTGETTTQRLNLR